MNAQTSTEQISDRTKTLKKSLAKKDTLGSSRVRGVKLRGSTTKKLDNNAATNITELTFLNTEALKID